MGDEEKIEREEPLYEKLASGEVLIISKKGNCVTSAVNEKGSLVLKEACLVSEE